MGGFIVECLDYSSISFQTLKHKDNMNTYWQIQFYIDEYT